MSDPETERLRADVKRMLRTLEEADAALKQARETCDMAWRMVLLEPMTFNRPETVN